MSQRFAAGQVPRLRRLAYRFLRENAPVTWPRMMEAGVRFHIPANLAGMGASKQARRLANAEARRLRRAQLFHMDAAAARVVEAMDKQCRDSDYVLVREMLPAEYGMLVWQQPIIITSQGLPVTGCHWQAGSEDVWVTWWTDAAAVDTGPEDPLVVALARQQTGPLGYEQEMVLPYGVVGADLRGDRKDARRRWELIRRTLTSWRLFGITDESVSVTQLPESSTGLEPEPATIDDPYGDVPAVPDADDCVTALTVDLDRWEGQRSRLRRWLGAWTRNRRQPGTEAA